METSTKTLKIDFSSGKAIIDTIRQTRKKDSKFEDFCNLRKLVINSKTEIIAVLHKMTIKEIEEYLYRRPGIKKDRLIANLWEAILCLFKIGKEGITFDIYISEADQEKKLIKSIEAVTEDIFLAWQADRAEKDAALQKALTNPETLEEYKTFIKHHREGEKALNSEQRAIYDELMTGIIRERKEVEQSQKDKVIAVTIGETDLLIRESYHAKKQIPLWVVQLSERVPRPIYEELNQRAQQLGGYYSSYKGQGAIPGFTFDRKEGAELFIQIKDGDVNAAELRQAINWQKTQYRAERVQDKADVMEERATEELQKDRLTNTARRARMANSVERQAIADIEFAKTLYEIGERTKSGTIKHLGRMADIVQLDALYRIMSRCKWDYIADKKIPENNFIWSPEVIDYAVFPYPKLYKDDIPPILEKIAHEPGKKLATARMIKRLNAVKGPFLTVREGQCMEDFDRLLCWSSRSLTKWETIRFREQQQKYKRIQKLGFTTIFELRAALRELLAIDQESVISPEFQRVQQIRELERKFINLNFPGFFPTPSDLAAEVVEKAQIEKDHTILEPEAGLGHLAEAITDAHPDNPLTCIENYAPLVEALQLKDLNAIQQDFLQFTGESYDRIVMNPPFENLADIDHVLHAWTLLKPGGRIVAIMADNKNGERRKIQDFREFVDQYGSLEQNEPDAFKSGFRPTGVRTVTVILDKPETEPVKVQDPVKLPKPVQGSLFFPDMAA